MFLKILVWGFVIFCILMTLYFLFPPVLVCGDSMYPTYQNHTILLTTRCFIDYKPGEVYVYDREDEDGNHKSVIKRLHDVTMQDNECYLYFLGDNTEGSFDSRHYGYVHHSKVMLKVVKVLKY